MLPESYYHSAEVSDLEYFLTHEELNQGISEKKEELIKSTRSLIYLIIGNVFVILILIWIATIICKTP